MDLKFTAKSMSSDRAVFQRHTAGHYNITIKTKMKPFWLKHKHWDAICPAQPYPIAVRELVLEGVSTECKSWDGSASKGLD